MRAKATCLTLVLAAACGPGPRTDPGTVDARPSSTIDAATGPTIDSELADFSLVYAHSGQELYRIDTQTLAPVLIGPLTGLGAQSLTDLAVDRDDHMVGVTLDNLVSIDPATGATTLIRDLGQDSNLTSLSFVPTDLDDPQSPERLLAATDQGEVLEIDPATGSLTVVGSYGSTAGGIIRSSGDLVAVRGFGIFATVTIGDTLTDPDYLARIDPVTFRATPLGIGTTYDRIFGIGFWRGTLFGFVDRGNGTGGSFIELDPVTGASTLISDGAIRWFGAGVTTDAPIIE
ncbi:MAG: hypothetical protein KBG28_31310 [Kofleriaceae bacterium]|jgi:hypothetical protein|nr:hypothetical protein [Kofleriaceae bacterium]MBP6837647.1 hypothetical protein [Kofleriaceae bacterium]MBP9208499.1 hypothetical protein [Kofleriaceae bacterium]